MYHERHTINGYIEKYLKLKKKIDVLPKKLKRFMKKALIQDLGESEMIWSDTMT
jgi:hypothetical protein